MYVRRGKKRLLSLFSKRGGKGARRLRRRADGKDTAIGGGSGEEGIEARTHVHRYPSCGAGVSRFFIWVGRLFRTDQNKDDNALAPPQDDDDDDTGNELGLLDPAPALPKWLYVVVKRVAFQGRGVGGGKHLERGYCTPQGATKCKGGKVF